MGFGERVLFIKVALENVRDAIYYSLFDMLYGSFFAFVTCATVRIFSLAFISNTEVPIRW